MNVLHAFRAVLTLSFVAVAAMVGLACWACGQLPADARVPMHWNPSGAIDSLGGRASLFILPAVALLLSLLLAVLPRIEPRKSHLLQSSRAYQIVWAAAVVFLAALHVALVVAALGYAVPLDRLAMAGAGALFVVIGFCLGRVRSNYFFGARTPWSLSSELSWNKTNRLAGRMFVCFGVALVVAVAASLPSAPLIAVLIAFMLASLAIIFPYSYVIWRRDEHKSTIGRT